MNTTTWRFRRIGCALAVLIAVPGLGVAQTQINQRVRVSPDGPIRIFNLTGSIRVIGWERDSIWAIGTVGVGGGQFYMGGGLLGAKLGVEQPGEKPDAAPATLEIHVPARSRVSVKTASATVDVTGVTGSVDISTVGGAVRLDGTLRQIAVETMDGDIVLAGSAPWMRAKSAGGGITLNGQSDDLGVSTVSGLVTIQGKSFQRCHISSVMADIRFAGALTPDATCEFESHGGSVELVLPPTTGAEFDVSTLRGSIENWLGRGPGEVRKSMRGQEATFTTGKGGARVTVRNFKGNVVLRTK